MFKVSMGGVNQCRVILHDVENGALYDHLHLLFCPRYTLYGMRNMIGTMY